MAQNRTSEPHNSGSEEEREEEATSEEEGYESEEEDEDKTSPPEPVTKKTPASKKPESSQILAAAKAQSSSSSDGSDSESDSPPGKIRKAADPNIKPLASKPMDDQSKSTKKLRSKPNSLPSLLTPAKPVAATKRPPENEATGPKRARRKVDLDAGVSGKKAAGNSTSASGDDSKKQLFQRLWSEDDEIVILQGMIDYTTKKKADPSDDLQAFLEYIKKSLHVDVSKRQLSEKVRRLKKKFENNASKGNKGKQRTFAKAHEQKAYELSEKFWGKEAHVSAVENDSSKANGKARKTQNQRASKVKAAPSKEEEEEVHVPNGAMELTDDTDREVNQNALSFRLVQISKSIRNSGLNEEEIVMESLKLMTGPKKIELEKKWKELRVMETELFLEKLDLIREQTKVMLDTLKSGR